MKLDKNPFRPFTAENYRLLFRQVEKIRFELRNFDWDGVSSKRISKERFWIRTSTSSYGVDGFYPENKMHLQALDSRLKFMSETMSRLEKLHLENSVSNTFQKQNLLLKTALIYLDSLAKITDRMRDLTLNDLKPPPDNETSEIEIFELTDEIDRIASQAEFNRMNLFQGDFATSSRTASMWFIAKNFNDKRRIFIATMTARSLGLRALDGGNLTLSSPGETVKILDTAIAKINRERSNLNRYLQDL
ncbi:hypothetical protein LPTSP3_g09030 [Leptospira kobayashii]|uniref:Flagellin N-terminal domain-containing protein n=1 Tax=Leptospira kobayashii TaxID=1917830 RepID=A0ABN6KEG2_9LEPT|nr:flagellar filament core protein flaB2 domain protein [Leptospira kobayashii]BDA77973.1 hypothetical protein LPTSP3_g09030 [Leptospira kobayashii]